MATRVKKGASAPAVPPMPAHISPCCELGCDRCIACASGDEENEGFCFIYVTIVAVCRPYAATRHMHLMFACGSPISNYRS